MTLFWVPWSQMLQGSWTICLHKAAWPQKHKSCQPSHCQIVWVLSSFRWALNNSWHQSLPFIQAVPDLQKASQRKECPSMLIMKSMWARELILNFIISGLDLKSVTATTIYSKLEEASEGWPVSVIWQVTHQVPHLCVVGAWSMGSDTPVHRQTVNSETSACYKHIGRNICGSIPSHLQFSHSRSAIQILNSLPQQ